MDPSGFAQNRRRGGGFAGTGPIRPNFGTFGPPRPEPYSALVRSRHSSFTKDVAKMPPWNHDLFETSSYDSPRLNMAALPPKLLNAEMSAPTGSIFDRYGKSAAPASFGDGSASSTGNNAPSHPSLGVRGGAAVEAERFRQARLKAEEELRAKKDAERLAKEAEEEAKRTRQAQLSQAEYEKLVEIAQNEDRGFVVQVEGLVYGTSAEDVQTAFGQYGETIYCFIVNEATNDENAILTARLTYERRADADTAVAKLDGAIADGRPLRVTISKATQPPPPRTVPTGPRNLRPTPQQQQNQSRNQNAPSSMPTPPPSVTPAPRTMKADIIEASVSHSYPVPPTHFNDDDVQMEVDEPLQQQRSVPTGPRMNRGAGARGRGTGRGRIFNGNGGGMFANGNGRGQGQAKTLPQRQESGAQGLLARIGVKEDPKSAAKGKANLLSRIG